MLCLPKMLLVGATGRDAGKTTFVCDLLRHFTSMGLAAAKVTVIRERNGECPRGGEGCGVCASVEGGFIVTEERARTGGKDTHRMLASGASRVFWLRTFLSDAEDGLNGLLAELGPDTPFICESNSLRRVVVPGLFLMVANKTAMAIKESAASVLRHADLVVPSDGIAFDFDIERIEFTGAAWRLKDDSRSGGRPGEEYGLK